MNSLAVFMLEKYFTGDSFVNLGNCLYNSGVTVAVISTRKGTLMDDSQNIQVESDASYSRTNPEQPDLFALIDENSVEKLLKSKSAQKLIREADNEGKLIIAVGETTSVLGEAGIVRGKKITAPKESEPLLQNFGALLTENNIEQDGNIFTVKNIQNLDKACELVIRELKTKAA